MIPFTRYIDPKTDFGFKRIFGREDSKEILKQFLYDLLTLPHPIEELNFVPVEQLPPTPDHRRGIYDLYCVDRSGQRFIVEMQQGYHLNLVDRALFYSTFAISQQAHRGRSWHFELLPVYCLVLLDVTLDDEPAYLRRVQLMEIQRCAVFYDKLTFVWVEIPKFHHELTADLSPADQWIYFLKHLPALQEIPAELAREPFPDAFQIAEEAALSPAEWWEYEGSLKQARVLDAQLAWARQEALSEGRAEGRAEGQAEGRAEGRAEGQAEGRAEGQAEARHALARSMLDRGLDLVFIAEVTGLSIGELQELSR
jgi:predicted transposase/invertase (TIGR01784 family)